MKPRFAYFSNWRQYEYVHMLCWCAKDLAWNRESPVAWVLALIPTFVLGLDFIWSTYRSNFIVDFAHYTAQLLWVLGNAAWSYGELFHMKYDAPIPITTTGGDATRTGRWWAGWLLLAAFIPIVLLYFVWLPWILYRAAQERSAAKEELVLSAAETAAHTSEFNPVYEDGTATTTTTTTTTTTAHNRNRYGAEGAARAQMKLSLSSSHLGAVGDSGTGFSHADASPAHSSNRESTAAPQRDSEFGLGARKSTVEV